MLFIEGDSDKILFSTLCEKRWGINIDEKGISVISCGGKSGVLYFVGVCKLIGFDDYFAIWDKDGDLDHLVLFTEAKSGGKGLETDPNLENFLGLPEGDDAEKVKNAHEWAMRVEDNKIPEEFLIVKKFIEEDKIADEENSVDIEKTVEENLGDLPF